jgi:glycosyltransferase involved in cell wall biosynthesis
MGVSFISFDYGQPDAEEIHGMKFYKTFRLDEGLRIFRFVYPRLFRYWRALSNANADIYYQRCAGMLTGLTAFFCKTHGRKLLFAAAHDTDFLPGRELINNPRDRMLYHYGLKRADKIVVQTHRQKDLLTSAYNLDSLVIPNCLEPPYEYNDSEKDIILWVSTLRRWKRPEIFLELASKLTEFKFVMIGGKASGEDKLYEMIKSRACDIKNLEFLGFVPFDRVGKYFDRARLFVNTSTEEGFPNTFLQAFSRGIPVITFFDPDDCIHDHRLGITVNSAEELMRSVRRFMCNETRLEEIGRRSKGYFTNTHSVEVVAELYVKAFKRLIKNEISR